jgi:Cu(I)/Ag(I) efflux system membrane fusion protein
MNTEPSTAAPPAPHKRSFGLGALVFAALLGAGAATTATLLVTRSALQGDAAQAAATLHTCPMHPSIVQDHPGTCPLCGMKLLPLEATKATAPVQSQGAREVLFYRSPSDPEETSHTPQKNDAGLDYVPVYAGELGGAPPVSGLATVEIDPERQQLIGLRTTEVTRGPVGGSWRTVGRVAIDETRVRHVNLKVAGFVERIYVDFIGKKVKRGDPLFSLYSPDLLAAQEELLLALRTQSSLSSVGGAFGKDGDALIAAARRKLVLWDVPPREVDRLVKTGEPTKTLTFYSPAAGVVTKKDVVEGMKLDAGAMPYEIVDLSSVWVLADVYESELRFVKEDMGATLELNALPGHAFEGKVVFIDPLLDAPTRTVKVRLTFPNPKGELRPGMFGEVVLKSAPQEGLRVPLDALIDSGTESLVFVAVGDGKFEPRRVELGARDGEQVEVLRGVSAGERVVTRANFLVDSESRLRASLADMAPSAPKAAPESARVVPGAVTPKPTDHSGHTP